MKLFAVLFALLLLPVAAWAQAQTQVPAFTTVTPAPAAVPLSAQVPSEAQILELIRVTGVEKTLLQVTESSLPQLQQVFQSKMTQIVMQRNGNVTPQQATAANEKMLARYNQLRVKMNEWMIQQYSQRHRASYTAAETQAIIDFYKSGVGQKYVNSDSQAWVEIMKQAQQQTTQFLPGLVDQAFTDAGLKQ